MSSGAMGIDLKRNKYKKKNKNSESETRYSKIVLFTFI
jgi:hypothetical protein